MGRAEQVSRRLKLRHLNVLLAVAEQGSMAKAARQLAVTQPVVSKTIADLEKILGVRLLERAQHGVEPTVYGRALLKHSVTIFDDVRAGVSELDFLADPDAGELRIGSTEAMGIELVPLIVERMSRQYPRIVFEIIFGSIQRLYEIELRGRHVELVIGRQEVPTGPADDLDVTVLFRDRLRIVVGRDSPWARKRRVSLADLVNERWCLPPATHPVGALITGAFRRSGLEPPRSAVTAPSAVFTSRMIVSGQYLGVLGSAYLKINEPRTALKILPVDLPVPDWPTSIATLKNRTLSPVAKRFVDFAKEITRSLIS
jgi:DNA-binding transcriptional LysR family regulator